MQETTLRYDKMVENALRSVVRDALAVAATHGLPGAHHFYVTFKTGFPGVKVPDFLRAQYPQDMTIVLEHQFWGLTVDDRQFAVTLSFQSQPHQLVIPLASIIIFQDPSVKFRLEFPAETSGQTVEETAPADIGALPAPKSEPAAQPDKPGEVVKLDTFRKK